MNKQSESDLTSDAVPLIPNMARLSLSSKDSSDTSSPSSDQSSDYPSSGDSSLYYRPLSSSASQRTFSIYEAKLRDMRNKIRLDLPEDAPTSPSWERLCVTLCDQVDTWAESCKQEFEPPFYDYFLIHTKEHLDKGFAEGLMKDLELEGLNGRSLMDTKIGDNSLDFATRLIDGSTKIFVLHSPPLSFKGIHRVCFQDVIMGKLREEKWKTKLVPIYLPEDKLELYYAKYPTLRYSRNRELGLSVIHGVELDDNIIEKIRHNCLTIDYQMVADGKRKRAKEDFDYFLDKRLNDIYKDIREVILKMRRHYGDNDPSSFITPICNELNSMISHLFNNNQNVDQIINMNHCSSISVGPSFNFSVGENSEDLNWR